MNFNKPLTRRESIKRLLQLGGSLGLAGAVGGSLQTPILANAASKNKKFIVEGIGQTEGYSVKALTRKVFEIAGGAGRFVSNGDVVVIKPNVSWARRPEMAATTNPEVLEAVLTYARKMHWRFGLSGPRNETIDPISAGVPCWGALRPGFLSRFLPGSMAGSIRSPIRDLSGRRARSRKRNF